MKHTFVHILCKKVTVLMLGVGLGTTLSAQLPYQNPDLTPEQRATDLLQRLTVEEKISLMQNNSPGIPRLVERGSARSSTCRTGHGLPSNDRYGRLLQRFSCSESIYRRI